MEDQAPYHRAAPRNLAPELAAWLRQKLGFTCTLQQHPTLEVLTAGWSGPHGEHFELSYTWEPGPSADALLRLRLLTARPTPQVEILFTAQRVRRLREARQLLNNCVRLQNARLLTRAPLAVNNL